jgi:hypothetical protein
MSYFSGSVYLQEESSVRSDIRLKGERHKQQAKLQLTGELSWSREWTPFCEGARDVLVRFMDCATAVGEKEEQICQATVLAVMSVCFSKAGQAIPAF